MANAERKKVPETPGVALLEQAIKASELTQQGFGLKHGILQSVLSEILNCWRLPTLEQALKLAKAGVPTTAWELPPEAKSA